MADVIVIGAGIGGLGTALVLAREGHSVAVLERDPEPPDDIEDAWMTWARRGVPQVRQPHFFLARLRKELKEVAPDLLAEADAAGIFLLPFLDRIPPNAVERDSKPGDEELVGMGARRTTFEVVLRDHVALLPNVTLHYGTAVEGLLAGAAVASVPHVTGVRTGDGEQLRADLVVDCSGRRSPLSRWLEDLGTRPPEEEEADAGLAYYSRYFRLREGAEFPRLYGPLIRELGYASVFTFPADNGTFTLAVAPLAADAEMRVLKDDDAFLRAMAMFPSTRPWVDPDVSTPISSCAPIARIEDRRRRLVVDGAPVVTGVVAVGDSAFCTNPVLGRGSSCAFIHARLLGEVLGAHGDDFVALSLDLDDAAERLIRPWFDDSLATDRTRFATMEAAMRGEPATPPDPADPAAMMAAAMQVASGVDGVVFRAAVRRINLLDPLDAITTDPDVIGRAIAVWERRDELPQAPAPPARQELLAAIT